VVFLISLLNDRDRAAFSAGADAFINKGETSERVVESLRAIAACVE
jgi:hypothetical protein